MIRPILILIAVLCSFAAPSAAATSKIVLVSVAPHKFFVERIAGGTLTVDLLVPAGASSHTFEPTPKQVLNASRADLWFQMGEGFEPRAAKALRSFKPEMQLIDLRIGVDLIVGLPGEAACSCHAHRDAADPHFWLSAREAKKQAVTIARALSQRYPEHCETYENNLKNFHSELDDLDKEISALLNFASKRTIMVSHPAYAYFCRDYRLKQLSVEFEGKDPTPQQLTRILQQAKSDHIDKIFIQMQYNNKGAKLIASTIGASIVTLDPYAENFMGSMREIAAQFAQSLGVGS